MKIENWIGDLLSYARCDNCKNTLWHHNNGNYLLYTKNKTIILCNRCPKPTNEGRIYKCFSNGQTYPSNNEAFEFEMKRAGQKGALFSRID